MKAHNMNYLTIVFLLIVNASITYSLTDSDLSNNNKSITINVVETRALIVTFVPIDNKTQTFIDTVKNNSEFLNLTYPLADNGLTIQVNDNVFNTGPIIGTTLEDNERHTLLKNLFKEGRVSGGTDRVVGISPENWFTDHGLGGTRGFTTLRKKSPFGLDLIFTSKSVIVEGGFRHGASHELGHTFGLCDEYNNDIWIDQNNFLDGCPNGDSDNNELLDPLCLDEALGCDTSTFGELIPYLTTEGEVDLFNFMGVANNNTLRWVSNDSYEHLLDEFSSFFSFITVDFGILISGTIDKNGTTEFDNAYILDEQSIVNESSSGNFSIVLESNGTVFHNLSFEPNFKIVDIGGNIVETNITYFAFVVPYSDNVTKILVKENETIIRVETNVTPNTPNITITSPSGNEILDKSFNITWNASDLDNDTIQYAVLISSDNGNSYSTLEIDYPNTSLLINSTNFVESNQYKIKILATDGINTGNDTSEIFSIYHDVNKFFIKNNSGSNIAWFGDAGNIVIKGVLEQNSNFQATDNFAFKIRNNLNDVLIIENNGSMYIDGTLAENQAVITSDINRNNFVVKNSGTLVANVNETGYVFLKGTLTQNGNP